MPNTTPNVAGMLVEALTQFQPKGSPLDNVKNPRGRVDVLASRMVQELALRYKANPLVGVGAQLLKPTIDRVIAEVLPSKPLAFAREAKVRKARKKVSK